MTRYTTIPAAAVGGELDRLALRRAAYGLLIAIAAGVSTANVLNVDPLLSANDRSRWATVWSLAERGTFQIDEIIAHRGWDTIDKVRHEDHFYSTKPALFPALTAGVYAALRDSAGLYLNADLSDADAARETAFAARGVLIVVNVLPFIAALIVLAMLVERYARSDFAKLFLLATAAFGTLLTTFLTTLNNHTPAAVCVVFSLYPAMRILVDGSVRRRHFLLAGFFAAFACTNELPAALYGSSLFALLGWRDPKRALCWFVPAALVPLSAFFAANYLATGGWKPFYMYYGTDKYRYIHEGKPSYWMNPQGIDRGGDSPLLYLLHSTVGHHGILSLTPVFLLTVVSWMRFSFGRAVHVNEGLPVRDAADVREDVALRLRSILWLGCGLTIAILAFYLSRPQNYNYGGVSAGLRWAIWLVPFWLVSMIPLLDELAGRRWFRFTATVLLLVSSATAFSAVENPWQHPWLFTLMERQGWIDYRGDDDDALVADRFDPPLTTWFPTLPETPGDEDAEADWVEFAGPDADGKTMRLRLTDGGLTPDGLRRIIVERNPNGADRRSMDVLIDEDAFRSGRFPSEFVVGIPVVSPAVDWTDEERLLEAYTFLRGMPAPREYFPDKARELTIPLRPGKPFICRRGNSRVQFTPAGSQRPLWYRCELWMSDEVPFGTVRVVYQVRDAETDAVVSRRTMTAVAMSRKADGE